MKFFPIKIAIICLLAPPFLYSVTLISYEKYLNIKYSYQIQNILIGDSKYLLEGAIPLEEQIADNIHGFLKDDWLVQKAGLDINVLVTTVSGKIIYPLFLEVNFLPKEPDYEFDPETLAKNNFESLNNGLVVKVETNLSHGSIIGNVFLVLYFGVSVLIFLGFYKVGSSRAERERKKEVELINGLKKEEKLHKQLLNDLQKERQGLFGNIKSLSKKYQVDKKQAKINEEELYEEIISLEEKVNSFIEFKQQKEQEIEELKLKINKRGRRSGSKTKRIEFNFVRKRFQALYKNILMNRKALSGFVGLSEDQQIKAEEIIHLLDRNPDKITIKRKVFSGKKHRTACFEVLFAYNGRLYFRNIENNIIEVLVIGTKNTQTKDMEFLHNL